MDIIDLRKGSKVDNDKKYYCCLCDFTYTQQENMYLHFQEHLNYKPYICRDCNQTFVDDITLEEHLQEFNHFKSGSERNHKVEYFLNCFITLSSIFKELPIEDIKKLKLLRIDKSINGIVDLLNKNNDSYKNFDMFEKLKIFKNKNEKNLNSIKELLDFISGNSKNGILKGLTNGNCESTLCNKSSLKFSNRKNPQYVKKMKNTGYLDLKMLSSKEYVKKKNISSSCKCCKIGFSNEFSMITHVFKFHLNIKNCALLKCAICWDQDRNSRSYVEFNSIRNHFENDKTIHKGINFNNNFSADYYGNDALIDLDGDPNILALYEEHFERCFIRTFERNSDIFDKQEIAKRKFYDVKNTEKVKKRKINEDEKECITINDEDDESCSEISILDEGSDIEVLYVGPRLCSPEFIPKPPDDLTLRNDIQPRPLDSNDVGINYSNNPNNELSKSNKLESLNHASEDWSSPDEPLQKSSSTNIISNISSHDNQTSVLYTQSNKKKNTSLNNMLINGGEDISDDDVDCQPTPHSDHISKQKASSSNMSSEKWKFLISGCEPISDDENNELPSISSDINSIVKNILSKRKKNSRESTVCNDVVSSSDIGDYSLKNSEEDNGKKPVKSRSISDDHQSFNCSYQVEINDSSKGNREEVNNNSPVTSSSLCLSDRINEMKKKCNLLKNMVVSSPSESIKRKILENSEDVPSKFIKEVINNDLLDDLLINDSNSGNSNNNLEERVMISPDCSSGIHIPDSENSNKRTTNDCQLKDKMSDLKSPSPRNLNNINLEINVDEKNSEYVLNSKNTKVNKVSIDDNMCLSNIKENNLINNCQEKAHEENPTSIVNDDSTPNCTLTCETLTEKNIDIVDQGQKNNGVINKNKNNGYPFYIQKCEEGCDKCKNIRCPKVSSCAKNKDTNWSYNVRLPLNYIYCSDYLNNAIKNGRIRCFCNLCNIHINETGADLIDHIVKKHLHFERFMFRCRLCHSIKSNDIYVIQKHWINEHSKNMKFVNNFIIRCQEYENPNDICITITSRENAKIVDFYKKMVIVNETKYNCLFCKKIIASSVLKAHIESHIIYPLYRCGECDFECYEDIEFLDHLSETFHLSSQMKNSYVELFVDRLKKITHYSNMERDKFKNQSFKILRNTIVNMKCKTIGIGTPISCLFCKEKHKCTDILNHISIHLNFVNINDNFEEKLDSSNIYTNLHYNVLLKCTTRMIEDDFLFAARYGLKALLENNSEIDFFSIPIKISKEKNLNMEKG